MLQLRYWFVSFVFILLFGCQEKDPLFDKDDASLQLRICVPDYEVDVKSVSSDPANPDSWTSWERAVDGRYLYKVAAFILQGDRLVACKDLDLQGEAKEATIEFDGNFTHGAYTLMVVANYSAFQANDGDNGTKSYNGISGFTSTVQQILSRGTIDNFTNQYSDSFLNFKISSIDGVCPRVPQPLTLVKNIELHPGTNVISGELLRTYSRIRISVENNSDEDLKISSLDFSDIFTQRQAYIFSGKGYLTEKSSIDVLSVDALTPFAGNVSNQLVIPAKGSSVIFDAYILESKSASDTEEYSYNLGLGYEGMSGTYALNSTTAITNVNNLSRGLYLIYNTEYKLFAKAENSSVNSASLGTLKYGMSIPKECVWALDNTGLQNNRYYIGTADAFKQGQTAYYVTNSYSSRTVSLSTNKTYYFTFANNSNYISMQSNSSGYYTYLQMYYNYIRGNNSVDYRSTFILYPIDEMQGSQERIPVVTIDNATGQPVEVMEIKRNDFINALVRVSYSKNQGHFTYEVGQWGSAGGDVEFN